MQTRQVLNSHRYAFLYLTTISDLTAFLHQLFLFIYFETGFCATQAGWAEAGLDPLIPLIPPKTMITGIGH